MPMSHAFRLIVFDFDGTLVDCQRVILATMTQAFAAHGPACAGEARICA